MYFALYSQQVLTGPDPEAHTIAVDTELQAARLSN
jgi:hypothetical protein